MNRVWVYLNFPAACFLLALIVKPSLWEALTPWTGYTAVLLLAFTLSLNPLQNLFPQVILLKHINRHRRVMGVAAFVYAFMHVLCFIIKRGSLVKTLPFLFLHPWIAPGFMSFLIMLILAATSNNFSVKGLGFPKWKKIHKKVYWIEGLLFLHISMLDSPLYAALIFVPLFIVQYLRRRQQI